MQQQQQLLRQGQQIQTQPSPQQQPIIQSQTPPISTVPINSQNAMVQNNYQQQQQIGISPSPVGPSSNNQQQQQQQPIIKQQPNYATAQVQPQQTVAQQSNFNYVQAQSKIWVGQIEWQEKDRNNPNNPNKMTHSVKASMLSSNTLDPITNQCQPEVTIATASSWPAKISIQLLSKQILDILAKHCPSPAKTLILTTDENNNQDLKQALSIGVSSFIKISKGKYFFCFLEIL